MAIRFSVLLSSRIRGKAGIAVLLIAGGVRPVSAAEFLNMAASPATLNLTANDPDGASASVATTITFTAKSSDPGGWTLYVAEDGATLSGCPRVPASALRVQCISGTVAGGNGGTVSCGGNSPMSTADTATAIGTYPGSSGSGSGERDYTLNLTISFTDSWRYPAVSTPCSPRLTWKVIGDAGSTLKTQTALVTINSLAKVSVSGATVLSRTGAAFSNYTGQTLINYRARTGPSTTAQLTVVAMSEFAPANGPTIPDLSFICSGASYGIGCGTTQSVSTNASRTVLTVPNNGCTGGGAPCSNTDPASVQTNFTLTNKPGYKTGSYSAQLTFTITTL